jgi:hypothetical protein
MSAETSSPEPVENVIPKPSTGKANRGSVASRAFDRGDKGFLDEDEALVRKYDKNGDGVIDINEVYAIISDVRAERAKKIQYKKYFSVTLVVATVMLASIFGLTWATAILARETKTSSNGELVSSSTGDIVATHARGVSVTATANMEFLRRARRHLTGMETDEDRRKLQTEDPIFATIPQTQVRAAYTAFVVDGTPITVSITVVDMTFTELMAGNSGVAYTTQNGVTEYTGFYRATDPVVFVTITCIDGAAECDLRAAEIGSVRGRRLFVPYIVERAIMASAAHGSQN